MRILAYLLLAFLCGAHGFALFVPYLILMLLVSYAKGRMGGAQPVAVAAEISAASPA